MAINKNFVIKNGAEINTKLLVADADNQKVGIGTTRPSYTLHIMGPGDNTGGIGVTYIYTTGITTTQALNVLGVSTFNAGPILLARGEQTGTPSQSLQVGTATTVSGAYISGNLGLANTNPTSTLHVVGSALITGVTTISGGITLSQGADLARLRVTGITTLGDATSASIVVSGVSTLSGGLNASQGADLARLRVTGITTLGQTNTTGLSNAGVSTLGNATASTLVVSGFTTTSGGTSATLLVVSGVSTFNGGLDANQGIDATGLLVTGVSTFFGGFNASQGADLARLRVTGITTLGQTNTTGLSNAGVSTLGNATASTLVVSGFSTESGGTSATLLTVSGVATVSGGLLASQGIDAARLRVTGITTLGDATATNLSLAGITTGLNASGISTLGFVQGTTSNITGFSTLGSVSAGNVTLAGITTGINAPGISTLSFLTGQSSNYSGISTLSSLTGTNVNYSGVGTINSLRASHANISGVTTTDSLVVNSAFSVFASDSTFFSNVTINGNLSIGGTSTILNADQIRIEDKDIILGFTTSQLPTDTTANHGGIAIASTEGFPLVPLQVAGINTLPDTYKQIMWLKGGTMGAGTTDAWLINYGVGIGSTQVPNGVRLAVGAIQLTDTTVNAVNFVGTNINASGITSTNSLNIGATQVISSGRQLQNIASLDATTTATIESAIANAPNTFTDLNVTGFSTLAAVSAGNLALAGITTGLNVPGIGTVGFIQHTTLNVSGFSTLGSVNAANLGLAGITTGLNVPGISTLTSVTGTSANFSGISTFANGPVFIGAATSTGTASQPLQVTGGAYVSGRLGIGITNPNSNSVLDVNGTQFIVKNAQYDSESNPGLYLRGNRSNGTVGLLLGADNTTGIAYIQPLLAGTTYSQNMSISAMGGNVGIGLTNPEQKLSISGTVQRDASIFGTSSAPAEEAGYIYKLRTASSSQAGLYFLNQYNNDNGTWMSFKTTSGSNVLQTALTIDSLAKTGIGSTLPTSKLDVAGDVKVIGIVTATGGFNLGIQTNGVNVTTGVVTALNFVGTGNTITYNAGTKTVSINIAGSGGAGGVAEIKTSGISTTNAIGVGSFATASFRSAAVLAQINQNAQYQVGRYLMIHDGTTVTVIEDAAVSTGSSMLGTFAGAIVGSNAELRVSLVLPQSTAGVATVTTKIDTITL